MERTQATQKIVFFRSRNIVGKMSEFKFRWKTDRERDSKVCQFMEWLHGIKNRKNNEKNNGGCYTQGWAANEAWGRCWPLWHPIIIWCSMDERRQLTKIKQMKSVQNWATEAEVFFSSVVIVHSSRFFNLHWWRFSVKYKYLIQSINIYENIHNFLYLLCILRSALLIFLSSFFFLCSRVFPLYAAASDVSAFRDPIVTDSTHAVCIALRCTDDRR